MRDLLALAAVSIMLVLSMRNAYAAYLMWGWTGLIALNSFLYGFMAGVTYVQVFAIIALTLILLGKDREKRQFDYNGTVILFLMFAFHCLLAAVFASPGLNRNWELCTNMLKTLLFCVLMPVVLTSRFRIHAMVAMIVLAISFLSSLDGLKFLASGGAHNSLGIGKFGDNNHFGMIIVMVLPLLLYLFQYTAVRLFRWGFLATLVVTTLAVVSTASRGGLIAMVVVAVFVIMGSRRKLQGIFTFGLVAVLIVQLAPASWFSRMDTMSNVAGDSSFMGRVTAWKRASAIALDNPILGGGFHAGQDNSLFAVYRYKPGLLGFLETPDVNYAAASHSIYFEILGDLGFVGLFIFLAILVRAFIVRYQIKRMLEKHGGHSLAWASDMSDMVAASLIAYVVGGALLSAAYFDLQYILVMLMEVLRLQVRRELLKPRPVPQATIYPPQARSAD